MKFQSYDDMDNCDRLNLSRSLLRSTVSVSASLGLELAGHQQGYISYILRPFFILTLRLQSWAIKDA
jgi:hypothetical protein